jgi:DNA-3-methyladenine glycosylase I
VPVTRCAWAEGDPLLRDYHDREWGRPVKGEAAIFEKLCLEGFQSGLSWLTILRKREAFRFAFGGFEPEVVARYGAKEVRRLLGDPSIVRNRAKIEATIANARATVALREPGTTLAELVWRHRPEPRPAPRSFADLQAETPESRALAKELRRAGFRFVGPTTVYATMQACGLVNDHLADCFVRQEVEDEQSRIQLPRASK